MSGRSQLLELYRIGLDAVHAGRAVKSLLDTRPTPEHPVHLLAAGKAACPMAAAALEAWGTWIVTAHAVTKDGYATSVERCTVVEASHPLPDERSIAAADHALEVARALHEDDELLVLISGGASALWAAPVNGVSLEELCDRTQRWLDRQIPIHEINAQRRRLSRIKGGGLAEAAQPAKCLTLAVSDVAGDPPELIGSGPTVSDDARIVGEYHVVASLDHALHAIEARASAEGLRVRNLGQRLSGPMDEVVAELVAAVESAAADGLDLIVVGGEPTVEVGGDGRGGRAMQLALELGAALPKIDCLAAGTDGTDGPTDAAGGFWDRDVSRSAQAQGLDVSAYIANNDAYTFLKQTGGLLMTGPTNTNVTDICLIQLR